MDVDPEIPDENGARDGKRRPDPKVHVVTGPDRKEYDDVREREAFHKEQAQIAKEKSHKLALMNQELRAQLQAAEAMKAEQLAFMSSLNQELASKSQAIAEMQQHEGQLEAQFIGDQEKLHSLYNQCNTMLPQLVESQRLLMQRNEDIDRLNRLLVQKKDEAIQLRAYSYVQRKKVPLNNPPPRRGTRANLDPARNSGTRTIEIPLNPVTVNRGPSGKSNPKHKAKLAATPAFADLLGTDVDTLSELIGKFEQLLASDNVTVNVEKTTPKKQNVKKSQRPPSKGLMNYIHRVLHDATYDKFNVEQAADFQLYNPAEPTKVAACKDGLADPAEDLFQWDFSPGYTQSRWNDLMIAKVVDAALEADGEDGAFAEGGVERDFLEAVMADKLVRYWGEWKGFQPRFIESLGRMETKREAKARGTQAFEQHQLTARSTSAKHRKFEDRLQTITATIEIKTDEGIAGDIATWERLLEMVEHLGEQGMSSEEEDEIEVDDAKILIYRVKLCIWREPRVVEYLRFVDAQMAIFKKHHRGHPASSRIRGGVAGSSKAPCGLPKSLYNGEWLKEATPTYLKELNVSKEAFGLPRTKVPSSGPRDMEFSQSSLALSRTFPDGDKYLDGHIRNRMGVFGVHFGDPYVLLDIPSPEEATAPDRYKFRMGDFRRPLWINPKFPYLLLLPRYNAFYGPLFSCLNVTQKNLPIMEVKHWIRGDPTPQIRWGLEQALIDRWLHLESLLRLTLETMMDLHGGHAAEGVYTFLFPICFRYTERRASSPASAVKIALRSRDAFLPLMAKITLMFILLDAHDCSDWRARLQQSTKLHWQWLVDLEHSAVGDMTIDRLGGIIDLTLSKSHPNHHLPRHVGWLLPELLGKHRVPLYFFTAETFLSMSPSPTLSLA
ncbi:hypothetical protein FB451DRAFT_1410342 [Mycena latifolia]|nr:hypothetical protein FB451DRAFT_1410342 [Mycena latifolia]